MPILQISAVITCKAVSFNMAVAQATEAKQAVSASFLIERISSLVVREGRGNPKRLPLQRPMIKPMVPSLRLVTGN